MITAGVDIGSLSADVVILKDNEILSYSIIPTGSDSAGTAVKALEAALSGTGLQRDDIEYIVSTGYGRVVVPFANKNITEISCHAKGAHWFFPDVRTILDMGGQDCKAIRCDPTGKVTNFVMNDKCAAGAGRSMEVVAKLLDVRLQDIGRLSLTVVDQPATISSMCTVFAKSEILALLRKGTHKNDILAGSCQALVNRVSNLLTRVGMAETFVISGGIGKNMGVVRRIEEKMRVCAKICFEPQIMGALGAAIFARDALVKQRLAAIVP
jgi:bzd-type benzoyl-CoA reductase Q subunit